MATEIATIVPLVEGVSVTSSEVTIYTVPASTKAVVKFISICNEHASTSETVTIWFVPTGQTTALAYKRYVLTVFPSSPVDIDCAHVLNADTDIVVDGVTGGISSISISGMTITNAS